MGKRQQGHSGKEKGKSGGKEHAKRASADSSIEFSEFVRPASPKSKKEQQISDTVNPPSPPDKKKRGGRVGWEER